MTGYMIAMGACIGCKQPFSFNPDHVPSIRINGNREPICANCVDRVNPIRRRNGLEPIVPHADAYGPQECG